MAWPINDHVKKPEHHPLTKDKARYVGDPVAVVVAESRALAKDAIELVEVDWEPLPAVTGIKEALAEPGAARARGVRHERRRLLEHRGGLARAAEAPSAPFFDDPDLVKIKEEYYLGPADPERDRAARRRGRPERRHGRVHGLLVDPDPAHPPHDAL